MSGINRPAIAEYDEISVRENADATPAHSLVGGRASERADQRTCTSVEKVDRSRKLVAVYCQRRVCYNNVAGG